MNFLGQDGPRLLGVHELSPVAEACSRSGWRLSSARTWSPHLANLCAILLETPVPNLSLGCDSFPWVTTNSSNASFSSSQTWEQLRYKENSQPWWKTVWFKGFILKHAFTFWISHLDRLLVRSRLVSWGLNTSPLCCLCNQQAETRNHILLHCDLSTQVWTRVLHRLGKPPLYFSDWSTLITWLSISYLKSKATLCCLAIQATVFFIWKERNSRLHNGSPLSHQLIFKQIDRCIKDIILARINRKSFKKLLLSLV